MFLKTLARKTRKTIKALDIETQSVAHVKRGLLFIVGVVLLLGSCASYKSLHFYSDVRSAYRDWGEREVKLLIDSSLQSNRDLAAASLYYLGLCLRDLVEGRKRFADEKIERIREDLKEHFKKVYALNKDFNLRNLCIEGIAYGRDEGSLRFLESVLRAHRDPSNAEQALRGMRPFILAADVDLSKTVPATLELLSQSSYGVFTAALYNLSLYEGEGRDSIRNGLANYVEINPNTYRNFLVQHVLQSIEAAEQSTIGESDDEEK